MALADFGTQRLNMVESQVRPSDVTDRRLMRAMLDLPRERFVPEWGRAVAYADEDVPVSRTSSRTLLAPRTLAKLIQAAEIQTGDRVLDIGCATGYSSAVLSRLAAEVIGLEEDISLVTGARETLISLELANVRIEQGSLSKGWAAGAPYDVILVNGGIPDVPNELQAQLRDGGRLVCILTGAGQFGTAQVHTKRGISVGVRIIFDAGAPKLAGFDRASEFSF
jgi:protein-L-isoaspartate(D-aspartate) O-methyltransferase